MSVFLFVHKIDVEYIFKFPYYKSNISARRHENDLSIIKLYDTWLI